MHLVIRPPVNNEKCIARTSRYVAKGAGQFWRASAAIPVSKGFNAALAGYARASLMHSRTSHQTNCTVRNKYDTCIEEFRVLFDRFQYSEELYGESRYTSPSQPTSASLDITPVARDNT